MAHLGYDTSPAHIHCVKLAGAGTILQRKMGQFFLEKDLQQNSRILAQVILHAAYW